MNKKLLIIIFVLIVSTISFARSFAGLIGVIPWHYGYSDIFNEDRISLKSAYEVPYLERPIEYPAITGFFIYLMWQLGRNLLGYAVLSWLFLMLCAVITALALHKLAGLINAKKDRIFWFFVFAPSLLIFSVYNWDIIAVMFMVLALYFYYKNKFAVSSIMLSLGFNAKLFPVIILPLMLLKTNIKNGIKIAAVFLAVFLALNLYFIMNSFDVWKATYLFHSLREPNIDSLWALTKLETNTVNALSIALFLFSYSILILCRKRCSLMSLSFASIALFLLFNKVFSPQFILWLLPFFVLIKASYKPFYLLELSNLIVFISTSIFILSSSEQIYLSISNISTIARSFILAYIVFVSLTGAQFHEQLHPKNPLGVAIAHM